MADSTLATRVKGAMAGYVEEARALRRELQSQSSGSLKAHWYARMIESELALAMKNVDFCKVSKEIDLCKYLGEKFREILPASAIDRMVLAESNPGALVISLTDLNATNEDLVRRVLELEDEICNAQSALHVASIACANAEAGAALSQCEAYSFDDLGLMDNLGELPKQTQFGMKYFRDVLQQRRHLQGEVESMTGELKKLRGAVQTAVNVSERVGVAKLSSACEQNPRDLLTECERIAARFSE